MRRVKLAGIDFKAAVATMGVVQPHWSRGLPFTIEATRRSTSAAKPLRILHLEDSSADAELIGDALREGGISAQVERITAVDSFARALAEPVDIILADHSPPEVDAAAALQMAHAVRPEVPFILVSGQLGEERAFELLKNGATDFVLKRSLGRLAPAIRRALRETDERRKLHEAILALRESEERYRFLADAIPQMAWTADPDGRTEYVNARWVEYTGVPAPELVERGWQVLVHPDDRARCDEAWQRSVESGTDYATECRIRSGADADYRWHLARAVPVRAPDGRVFKWFGTCTDVDAQRRTAEALERNQERLRRAITELSRSNHELHRFGTIISHDLRQPLQSIILNLRVLQRVCKAKNLDEIDELVSSIVTVVDRMSELMGATLEYSRVGGAEFAVKAFPLREAVDAAQANLAAVLTDSQATLEVGDLPEITGYPALLTQLFQNLIENAVKYRGPAPPRIQISARRADVGWKVEVADNGEGIAPADSGRLFEIFQRPVRHSSYPGTGVGLSICKRIVERHGGEIWFVSTPGVGTTFHFTLLASLPGPMTIPDGDLAL